MNPIIINIFAGDFNSYLCIVSVHSVTYLGLLGFIRPLWLLDVKIVMILLQCCHLFGLWISGSVANLLTVWR